MSQAEELLNSLSSSNISTYLANSEEEPHIVIGDDRVIVVPESLKRIAVQYDHNVETVTFDCPRYWDSLDMSTMTVYINYMLPNRSMGSYPADNVTVDKTDSNLMHFDWTISRNVTSYKGNISFLVCIKKVDSDGNEENHWNSELNTDLHVSQGLETHEVVESTYPDIITQLLTRMDHIIAADSTALDTSLTETGLAAEAAATGKAIAKAAKTVTDTVKTICMTPQTFGAVGDGHTDDTNALQDAVNYITTNGGSLCFSAGKTYVISKPIQIISSNKKSFEINFNYCTITTRNKVETTTINGVEVNSAIYVYTDYASNERIGTIKNLTINGQYENIHTGLYLHLSSKMSYENINCVNVRRGIFYEKGVESFFNNIHMARNSGLDILGSNLEALDVETTDCVGIECAATDSHFSNIIIIDFVVGMKMTSGDNRIYGAHVWNYYCKHQYTKSVAFINGGTNFYTNCVADHFFIGWYIYYATPMYLDGCNITCTPIKTTSGDDIISLNSYAFYFGDKNSKNRTGSDIVATNTRIHGDSTDYGDRVTLTFSNVSDCNINYSGIADCCENIPDRNMPVMVSGKTIIDDKNDSKINQYGNIKSIEKVIEFDSFSTDFSDITNKIYKSGTWLTNYLQVGASISVTVNEKTAEVLATSAATGYNYLKLYLSRMEEIKNQDFIMIAYKYKTNGSSKVAYCSTANSTPYTSYDSVDSLVGDGEWHNGYRFLTVTNANSIDIGFGDYNTVDTTNALYLTDIRILNLSKYNIPKYYLETDKAYRARLIALFGTGYTTSVTIPARNDISFMSIPYKFGVSAISSEKDQMLGFSSSGKPLILERTSDYNFDFTYTNDTPTSVVFALDRYTIDQSGEKDISIEVRVDNVKIYTSHNYSYVRNVVVPSGSTMRLSFIFTAGSECKLSKLNINPYSLTTPVIVDSTDGYSKIPLYTNGEICLVAKGKSGTALPTAYFEVQYCDPYDCANSLMEIVNSFSSLSSTLNSNKTYYLTGEYNCDTPITIESLHNTTILLDNATVKYSGSAGDSHILKFNNCTNVTIIGGIFDGNHLVKRGIMFYNSTNCRVSKTEVKNIGNSSSSYSAGIDFTGDCSRSVISDSIVHDVISGVVASDGYIHSVGIGMSSNLGLYSKSVIIDGAQIYNIKGQSSTINDKTTDGDGVYIIQKPDSNDDTWDSHISIRNCHITKCSKRGIKATARHINIYNTYVDVDSWGPAVDFQLGNGKIVDSYIHNGSNVSCVALSWDNGKTSIENCKIVGSGNNMGIVLNGRLGSSDSRYTSEPQCVDVIGSSIDDVISAIHPGDNNGASENYNSLRFINNRVGSFSEKAICLYQDNATKAQRINSVKSIVIDGLYFKEALTSTQTPVYLGTSSNFINPANTLKVVDGIIDFRDQFSNIPFTAECIDFGSTKADFDKVFQKANNALTFKDGTYTANGDTNSEVAVRVLNNDITITASNVTATRSIYIPIGNLSTDIPYANFNSDYKYDWAASSTLTSGSYSGNATIAFANDKLALISSNTILALNKANKHMTISGLSGTASKLRVQVKAGVTMTASCKVTLVRQEPVFVGDLESRIAKLEYAVSNLTAE